MVERRWWDGVVAYQVYARSFADANGDGVGDLDGIRTRLPYVAALGADAVWVTPFYPGPGFDHGYDVADYCDVHPMHGTLADFDRLTADAHDLGLRVLIDLVPNHTSSHHPWFRAAIADVDSPYRDYYLWRDPAPDGGPPNNWVSHFGGSAWTLDAASGQYYCHLFLPEQPDLNWANPAVADEFDAILRFWCERGVDGFRIDVAHALTKDPWFRDNPQLIPTDGMNDPGDVFSAFEHRYDLDQNSNIDVHRRWHQLVQEYDAVLLGETGPHDPVRLARYHDDGNALDRNFYLKPVWMGWSPMEIRDGIRSVHLASPGSIAWVTDNHDSSRSVTRYGGGDRGRHRSLAVTALMAGLGGMLVIYEGQELGLPDGDVARGDLEDPIATRNPGAESWRDGARTVMPWDGTANNGFSIAETVWLSAAPRPTGLTVAGQTDDPDSSLNRYRQLIALRRSHSDLTDAPLEWLDTSGNLLMAYRRGSVLVAANLDDHPAPLELPTHGTAWTVLFTSSGAQPSPVDGTVVIPDETTVIMGSG